MLYKHKVHGGNGSLGYTYILDYIKLGRSCPRGDCYPY